MRPHTERQNKNKNQIIFRANGQLVSSNGYYIIQIILSHILHI